MSEPEPVDGLHGFLNGPVLEAWRRYYAAAIGGMLAAGQLDPRGSGIPDLLAEVCAKVADAAMQQEELRQG